MPFELSLEDLQMIMQWFNGWLCSGYLSEDVLESAYKLQTRIQKRIDELSPITTRKGELVSLFEEVNSKLDKILEVIKCHSK